jgi:hypothetical protein
VILSVEEVDLVRELSDRLLVSLVGVLHTEHLQALPALVELLESLDLILSHVDLLLKLLELVLDLTLFALEVLELDAEPVSTLVCTGQFLCPSLVRLCVITLEFIVHTSSNQATIGHIIRIVVNRMIKFKLLLMPASLRHHVEFPSLENVPCEPLNHLIL